MSLGEESERKKEPERDIFLEATMFLFSFFFLVPTAATTSFKVKWMHLTWPKILPKVGFFPYCGSRILTEKALKQKFYHGVFLLGFNWSRKSQTAWWPLQKSCFNERWDTLIRFLGCSIFYGINARIANVRHECRLV